MKVFDFEKCSNSPERIALMKEYQHKPITEDAWVELVKALPRKKMYNWVTRSPSAIRNSYRKLKSKFGFFTS